MTDRGASQVPAGAAPGSVRIGRAGDNQVSLPHDLGLSNYHAEMHRLADGGFELVDLSGRRGSTFVNHTRVKRARLSEGDLVSLGGHAFRFAGETLVEESVAPSFEAVGLRVEVTKGQRLLDGVSFSLQPSTLLAVVGPSGAGKTTLLNALTGFRPADSGSVFYGGRDLYQAYDDLRHQLGYVPQENIFHPQLTVRRALRYAADLRFSQDVDRQARNARVAEVIEQMGLSERADTRIERLSGGQRKRVNVGLELLTRPQLLFLDEPTSGLDPGTELEMIELLQSLTAEGRVVIVVTHSMQSLHLCDRVLFMAPGGRVAYFGPPQDALAYFGEGAGDGGYATAFSALERSRDIDWKARFEASPAYAEYVQAGISDVEERQREAKRALPPPARHGFLRQLRILVGRQVALLLAEPKTLLVLLLQAPLLGLLYLLVFDPLSLSTKHGDEATLLVWLLAVGATWLGVANSIREVVKELPIYRRERSVGLSIGPYLTSKALFLSAITALQAIALVGVALAREPLPPADPRGFLGPLGGIRLGAGYPGGSYVLGNFDAGAALGSAWFELAVAVALSGIAAVALGLLLSTVMKTSNQALATLPLILAVQIVLSLPLFASPFADVVGTLSSARWATDANASTVSLNTLRAPIELALVTGRQDVAYIRELLNAKPDGPPPVYRKPKRADIDQALRGKPAWNHLAGTWWTSVGLLVLLAAVPLTGAWFVLRRGDRRVLAERPKPAELRAASAANPAGADASRRALRRRLSRPRLLGAGGALATVIVVAAVVTNTGGAGRFPNGSERKLLAAVPESLRGRCKRLADLGPREPRLGQAQLTSQEVAGARAVLFCHPTDRPEVLLGFFLFPSPERLERWYSDRIWDAAPILPRGSCNGGPFPFTDAWHFDASSSVPRGRLVCFPDAGRPRIDWTHTDLLLGGEAVGNGNTSERSLFAEWAAVVR